MFKLNLSHDIHCDSATFWKIFLDEDFNQVLHRKQLGYARYDIVENNETSTQQIRKVRATSTMELPQPLLRVLGSRNFGFTEEGTLDKGTGIWKFKSVPTIMADRIRHEGSIRVEPAGAGKVRRCCEITFEARILLIGGLFESIFEKSVRDNWGKSAIFMNEWIREGRFQE